MEQIDLRSKLSEDKTTGLERLKKQIDAIEKRNCRVEGDKAWETSGTRAFLVATITYLCASLLLVIIRVPEPLLGAFVPTLGFLLSTVTLPPAKRWWLRKHQGPPKRRTA